MGSNTGKPRGGGAPRYGFPARFWRRVERAQPPATGSDGRWRSPLRGRWLTSVFGLVLLIGLPIVIITGLLSYVAYGPQLGQAIPADVGWLHLPFFAWPTSPSWLYRLTQGTHVILGLMLIPVVLAKLWSVLPKLLAWPPARSLGHVLERLSLLLLVGGVLFEMVTGVLDIQYDYIFGFSFYTAHYFGAWVFVGAFVVHISLKIPIMVRALRSRSFRKVLRTPRSATTPDPPDDSGLVAPDPAEPTVSRRGALGLVGGGTLLILVLSAGETVGGVTRWAAVLLPRGRHYGTGPGEFQVNKTADAAGIAPADVGPAWHLTVHGGHTLTLDRHQLFGLPQHTARLPIACVEGWSTTQTWTGVRLADLAAMAGIRHPRGAHVESVQRGGPFGQADLQANQVLDPDALLALRVNGVDLPLDHGYPARVIVPALPGVHNTKWVGSISFRGPDHA